MVCKRCAVLLEGSGVGLCYSCVEEEFNEITTTINLGSAHPVGKRRIGRVSVITPSDKQWLKEFAGIRW